MEIGCEKHTIVRENSTKPGKLVLIFFQYYEWFLPILFPSCGILRDIGNAWFFYSISQSIGKYSKTHGVTKAWEIGTHTFPIE